MGYRYGEHKYSEGRYSRWPDWWHNKTCLKSGWQSQSCDRPVWTPIDQTITIWPGKPEPARAMRGRNVERR